MFLPLSPTSSISEKVLHATQVSIPESTTPTVTSIYKPSPRFSIQPENYSPPSPEASPPRQTSLESYACPECTKVFPKKYKLTSHLKTVHVAEEDKEFNCTICQAKFIRSHDLSRHLKTHSLEKPYTCRYCGRGFSRRDALRRHEQPSNNRVCASAGRGKFRNLVIGTEPIPTSQPR